MTDYISRQAVKEDVERIYNAYPPEDTEPWILDRLETMPPPMFGRMSIAYGYGIQTQ